MNRAVAIFMAAAAAIAGRADAQSIVVSKGPGGYDGAVYVREQRVAVSIHDAAAVVSIEQVFANRSPSQLEGIYTFQVPREAAIDAFSMFMDGREVVGEVLERQKAREIYESIVARDVDPGLVEMAGYRTIRARVFPIPGNGDVKVRLKYSQLLEDAGGLYEFAYPVGAWPGREEGKTGISVSVHTTAPLKSVVSPTHLMNVKRTGENDASAMVLGPAEEGARTFRLYFDASDRAFGMKVLTYRTEADGGYFMLLAAPKVDFGREEIAAKDVVFVMDTSGSMQGVKIEQARCALLHCLKSLRQGDRFNVITFSTGTRAFSPGLAQAGPETIAEAAKFVGGIVASGGTNIEDALKSAFNVRSAAGIPDAQRTFQVIFLTDGLPTIGERGADRILSMVKAARTSGTRVFTFGVGDDVDHYLLDRLAADNSGAVEYVKQDESIEIKLSSLYAKIAFPVLTDIAIDFGSTRVDEVHPDALPDIFAGSQIVLFGTYRNPGHTAMTLTGNRSGKRVAFIYPADFASSDSRHEFIPRLWARRRVEFLMRQIRLHGRSEEIKNEIVSLGTRWGIVTEYTSFLVVEDGELQHVQGGPRSPGQGFAAGGAVRPSDPVSRDSWVDDHNEDHESSKGIEEALSDRPFQGKLWNSSIGIGGGAGGRFGGRFGGMRILSGSPKSAQAESAVQAGLEWLKKHQSPAGSWSSSAFASNCPGDACSKAGSGSDLETTGMAMLAFLSAGHSYKYGKFRDVVKNATKFLKAASNPDGSFGAVEATAGDLRAHAVCTLALSELYAMSHKSPMLHSAAQKAVKFLVSRQTPDSGWGAGKGAPCDTVTTAVAVLALRSARASGLAVGPEVFDGAMAWFSAVTDDSDYRAGLYDRADRGVDPANRSAQPEASTAAAAISRILIMGKSAASKPEVASVAPMLSANPPKAEAGPGGGDPDYMWFGTMAAFQFGGQAWKSWNGHMVETLLSTQEKAGCAAGSWAPEGERGAKMGRAWATAANLACLAAR